MKPSAPGADEHSDVKCTIVSLLLLSSLVTPMRSVAEPTLLVPETTFAGTVDLTNGQSARFLVEVPDNAYAVRFELDKAQADLDLLLEGANGELLALSESERYNEELFLSRITDPALASGSFTLSVLYQYVERPVVDGRELSSIPFHVRFVVVEADAHADLRLGVATSGTLLPEEGMLRTYRVVVDASVSELRFDIFDSAGDLDLFLNYGSPAVDPLAADYVSQSYLGRESLVVTRESRPSLRNGPYYVTVLDQIENENAGSFSIIASADGVPQQLLGPLAGLPLPEDGLERALAATVQVITAAGGGSGSVISPRGHIVTSWHVVRGYAGLPDPSPVVAVSIDHAEPAEERFRARVLRYSEERDLALLVVETGLYGRPLPADFAMAHHSLGSSDDLTFGDDLWFIGYPDVGGTGSRPSVTLTRGVVSGFERSSFGVTIKSDGEINEGNSGGAALDDEFRLVGLPTRVVGQDAGQLAYIHPLSAMPSSWWEIIAEAQY